MIKLELALNINKISQKELSAITGINPSTISQIISEGKPPTSEQADRIMAVFPNCKRGEIFENLHIEPKAKAAYKAILTHRKLPPHIQMEVDRAVAEELKAIEDRREAKRAALVERGIQTAKKINER